MTARNTTGRKSLLGFITDGCRDEVYDLLDKTLHHFPFLPADEQNLVMRYDLLDGKFYFLSKELFEQRWLTGAVAQTSRGIPHLGFNFFLDASVLLRDHNHISSKA